MVHDIDRLLKYALDTGLIEGVDAVYARNCLLDKLGLDAYSAGDWPQGDTDLEGVLAALAEHAVGQGIIQDSAALREQFETALMGLLTPRPSQVIERFNSLYAQSPKAATDYYYKLSQDSNYIHRYRTQRDMRWKTGTEYGELDITINLAKPEKDPRDIAAARNQPKSGYPACLLCMENEGYAGRIDHPARQNHRIIPISIGGEAWGFQYSPYVYYNEHCIVLNAEHVPMVIDEAAFRKLFSFVEQFPHYFVGSNADLPIVGGSILSHEHFQGGRYTFPMARAQVEQPIAFDGFGDVKSGLVKWPMSVIRLSCADSERLVRLASKLLDSWRGYTDEAAFIFARSGQTPHNTITPIARMRGEDYELDLVLRNNITTSEHPMGVYHPHAELHHIKKENIGLIEVMGLAVLPARLKGEIELMKHAVLCGEDPAGVPGIEKHAQWMQGWEYESINEGNIDGIIQHEIGQVFRQVLEHAGVFKRSGEGREAFMRFVSHSGGSAV